MFKIQEKSKILFLFILICFLNSVTTASESVQLSYGNRTVAILQPYTDNIKTVQFAYIYHLMFEIHHLQSFTGNIFVNAIKRII